MRTAEILDVLAVNGTVQVTATKKCCTVRLLYSPFTVRQENSVFDAAFQVVKHLAEIPPIPDVVREALEVYDRKTELLI